MFAKFGSSTLRVLSIACSRSLEPPLLLPKRSKWARSGGLHSAYLAKNASNLGEVTEAERLDDVRLYGCGLLVHSIGAKCGADHSTRGAAAFGLCHELCDCLGDVVVGLGHRPLGKMP